MKKKLRASAMHFAIFLSSVIALLLISLLLYFHVRSVFVTQSNQVLQLVNNVNDVFESFRNEGGRSLIDSQKYQGELNTLANMSYWGSYEKLRVKSHIKRKEFGKIGLMSISNPSIALYLENNSDPLKMGGNSLIDGKSFIPGGYVKPTYFRNSSSNFLIEGTLNSSDTKLPKLDDKWLSYVDSIYQNELYSVGSYQAISEGANLSFHDQTENYYSRERVNLTGAYSGNLIIKSNEKIIISSQAKLDQVILIAPEILVENGFHGSVHLFAESLKIEENVELSYPSTICALQYSKASVVSLPPKILVSIDSDVKIRGNIFLLNRTSGNVLDGMLFLEKESMVEGAIYNQGYTELKGEVKGSLYTSYFISSDFGGSYVNTVVGGRISVTEEHEGFVGLPLDAVQNREIALWLY